VLTVLGYVAYYVASGFAGWAVCSGWKPGMRPLPWSLICAGFVFIIGMIFQLVAELGVGYPL